MSPPISRADIAAFLATTAGGLPQPLTGMSRADQYDQQRRYWQALTRYWRTQMFHELTLLREKVAQQQAATHELRVAIVHAVTRHPTSSALTVADIPALLGQGAEETDPGHVGLREDRKYRWRCTIEESHGTWAAPPKARSRISRPSMCPKCTGAALAPGELPAFERSIAALPSLAAELHLRAGRPEAISFGSNEHVRWQHTAPAVRPGTGRWYLAVHEWEQTPKSRTGMRSANGAAAGVNGCRVCNSDQADASNSLASWYPEIAAQWVAAPIGRTPHNTPVGSRIEVTWACGEAGHPAWDAPPNRRTTKALRSGCASCAGNVSAKQMKLYHELHAHLPGLELEAGLVLPPGPGDRYRTVRVDMREVSLQLVVEFDGWKHHGPQAHRDRADGDRRKTERLLEAGETVIRVREDLDPLGPHDVVVRAGWPAWKSAFAVLQQIRQLGVHPVPGLEAYREAATDAASAEAETALLDPRRTASPPPRPLPQPRAPRKLKATPPAPGSRLTPIGVPYLSQTPRAGSLRDYACICGTKLIGAVQADVTRGNTRSCGCLAEQRKTGPRTVVVGRPLSRMARQWAAQRGYPVAANGALPGRVLASYLVDQAGRHDLLGPEGLLPELTVRAWATTASVTLGSRGRLPTNVWTRYAAAVVAGATTGN